MIADGFFFSLLLSVNEMLLPVTISQLTVFSKCFCAGFGAFSKFKSTVKGGTRSYKLIVILKLKTFTMIHRDGKMIKWVIKNVKTRSKTELSKMYFAWFSLPIILENIYQMGQEKMDQQS